LGQKQRVVVAVGRKQVPGDNIIGHKINHCAEAGAAAGYRRAAQFTGLAQQAGV